MGVYLSDNPLDKYRDLIDENITAGTAEIFDSILAVMVRMGLIS